MKKCLFTLLVFCITFVNANEKNEITVSVHDFAFEATTSKVIFAKAICSATVGNVEIAHITNCFLCSQAAADRKCQRQLQQILDGITENGACNCP
jgi:hypothetical protein